MSDRIGPRWIPSDEQVPDADVDVLVCGDTGAVFIARWAETKWGNRFISTDWDHAKYGGQPVVTHWMPLPEPPESDQGSKN